VIVKNGREHVVCCHLVKEQLEKTKES